MKTQRIFTLLIVTLLVISLCSCGLIFKRAASNQSMQEGTTQSNQPTTSVAPNPTVSFVGNWNRTNVPEAFCADIKITNQKSNTFDFEFKGSYTANEGQISGSAKIVGSNQAIFTYKSEYSDQTANITFIIGNGLLKVSADNNDALGFGHNVTIDGTYSTSDPVYTNVNLVDTIFPSDAIKQNAKKILGKDAYDQMLLVIKSGVQYEDNKLNYSGFISGVGVGVDIKIVGDYYYFLGYYLDQSGETLYTNDPAYRSKLPDFFTQRPDTDLNFVYKSIS